jgi:putative nucleotidyltransferase with HDIG domain
VRTLIFLCAFLLVTFVLFFETGPQIATDEFIVGEPAPRSLFAPFEMVLTDVSATEAARRKAAEAVLPVYSIRASVLKGVLEKLDIFFNEMTRAGKDRGGYRSVEGLPFEVSSSTERDLINRTSLDDVRNPVNQLVTYYLSRGILDSEEKKVLASSGVNQLTVIPADVKKDSVVHLEEILTVAEVSDSAAERLSPELSRDRGLRNSILEIFRAVMVPNLEVNESEMHSRKKKTADAVEETTVKIKREELVAQRGMLVTAAQKWKIDGIQKKLLERKIWGRFLALGGMVFVVYALFFVYLFSYDRQTLFSLRRILLIHSIFLTGVVLCKLFAVWPGSSPYLMPAAIVPILLVLLLRMRFGILSAVCMSLLTAPLSDFSAAIILASLLSGVVATFAAFHVRKRVQFLRLGVAVGAANAAAIFFCRLFQGGSFWESLQTGTPGLMNGFLITMPLSFLLLPIFEWFFDIVTDISLLELSDLNHPLLKRMIVEAPGTYHHSLVVSSLAESACEAIGANGLLARVGSYFHDIGKIHKAQFFVENQANTQLSKHEGLAPRTSAQIIKRHVRDGLDLGKKYKLKERILQFIVEHHGDGVISFFYRKAMAAPPAAGEGEVREDDFRYDGPKPKSKETAVVLLADSVEAASRSVEDPSQEAIEDLVAKIIRNKLADGQLDECDLTMRDFSKIEGVFVHNLMAILHTRMSYPSSEDGDAGESNSPDSVLPKTRRPFGFSKFR